MDTDLIAFILDNECDPPNPYEIRLHCTVIGFKWERVRSGELGEDGKWVYGEYKITEKYIK